MGVQEEIWFVSQLQQYNGSDEMSAVLNVWPLEYDDGRRLQRRRWWWSKEEIEVSRTTEKEKREKDKKEKDKLYSTQYLFQRGPAIDSFGPFPAFPRIG